jgi:glycosyltransferase involved in cell wall biosynthesis
MNNNFKVSILIATYNQTRTIYQAVNSALSQTYPNLEVIVSDDSENLETEKLLKSLGLLTKVKYYRNQKNIGRVANYNKLLYEYANGDWVVVLDGDDYYVDNTYIQSAVDIIMTDNSLVMVSAGHIIEKEEIKNREIIKLVDKNILFEGSEFFTRKIRMPQHSTNLYNRKLACEIGFYWHPSNASDAEGLYKLCLHGKVAFLKDVPVVWRIHGENTTYSKKIGKQIKELDFIDSIFNYSLNYLDCDVALDWRKSQYVGHSYHLLYIAYSSKNIYNVLYICVRFYKYWGLKKSFTNFYIYLETNVENVSISLKCFYYFLLFQKKVIKKII